MLGYLSGLEPNKLDSRIMRFTRGCVASYDGVRLFTYPTDANDIDLSIVGLWGLDIGEPQPFADYFPYVVTRDDTHGIVLSTSPFGPTLSGPLTGFQWRRKLPFGIVLDGAANIRDMHVSHWPGKPAINYTGVEGGSAWNAIPDGGSSKNTWTSVSLTKWVPDNARYVWLHCEVSHILNGAAGSAYVRVQTNTGLPVGNASPASGVRSIGVFPTRIKSDRSLEYMTTGDVRLAARVVRYEMTEPTT